MRSKITAFKNEVRNNPQVLSVSTAQAVPGSGHKLQPVFYTNKKWVC